MRHLESGRKLGVGPSHRKALLRNLTLALIEHDSIQTSVPRAKELRWYAERVVTLAKRGGVSNRRRIVQILGSTQNTEYLENRVRKAIDKVFSDYAVRFKNRPGGYTQILKLSKNRPGDNSPRCVMRYIPVVKEDSGGKSAKKSSTKGKSQEKETKKIAKPTQERSAKSDKPKKAAPKKEKTTKKEE